MTDEKLPGAGPAMMTRDEAEDDAAALLKICEGELADMRAELARSGKVDDRVLALIEAKHAALLEAMTREVARRLAGQPAPAKAN